MEKIRVTKHFDGDKVEYSFINFDYIDGIDYIAKFLCQEYQMQADEKFDGIWFSIIKLHKDSTEYELWWHEDWGNSIKVKRKKELILELEQKLEIIVDKLNEMMKL